MSPIHWTFHSNSTQIAPTPPKWIIGVFGGSVSEVECLGIKTPLGFHHTLTCSIELTTTIGGYFVIQISSQTTKKDVSEIPLLRTIIPCKFLSFCDTITFAPVQSQVLRNFRTWYNRQTFPITTASIHCLRLTLHQKLFAVNPSPQRLSEPIQNSIGFRYKI
jgi:hypothetical protein